MNLSFKTYTYLCAGLIVLIAGIYALGYFKGHSNGYDEANADWRTQLANASLDTSGATVPIEPPKPNVKYIPVVRIVKDTSALDSLRKLNMNQAELIEYLSAPQSFTVRDSIDKDLGDGLRFLLLGSHDITVYATTPAKIETKWDSLKVPIREITKVVIEPRSTWETVGIVAGSAIGGALIYQGIRSLQN